MSKTAQLTMKRWIMACSFGWLSGVVLVILTSGMFDSVGLEGFQFYLGISMGGSIGFFQWKKISRTAEVGMEWIWSSMFGMGIPFLLIDLLKRYTGFSLGDYFLPVSIAAGALLTAIWQMRILKRNYSSALLWLWTCFGGWIFASLTLISIDYVKLIIHHNMTLFFINLTLILSGGSVLGAVTGATLIGILRRPNSVQ